MHKSFQSDTFKFFPQRNLGPFLPVLFNFRVQQLENGMTPKKFTTSLACSLLDSIDPIVQKRMPWTRGVRLAKNDFCSLFGSVLQKTGFRFGFGFTKFTAVSFFFGSVRPTFVCRRRRHLSFAPLRHDGRNDVLPC